MWGSKDRSVSGYVRIQRAIGEVHRVTKEDFERRERDGVLVIPERLPRVGVRLDEGETPYLQHLKDLSQKRAEEASERMRRFEEATRRVRYYGRDPRTLHSSVVTHGGEDTSVMRISYPGGDIDD